MYYPRFTKVIIHYFLTQDKTLSWRYKIEMHTSTDDYLINTLRFVSVKEETQIYGAILLESLTSPEMNETQAYKTYLGFATGATPPKKERKFKKPASPKLTIVLVSTEELTRKPKRVKRHAKKSTEAPARGVIIRETPEMPLSKKKEKVDVTRGKGIELLSQVDLTEDAQFEEVRRKSMRDFHKTHPVGSGTVTKTALSVAKIKPSVTSEGTGVKPGVLDVAEEESSKKEEEDEFVRTPFNDFDEDETKITDKAKGDKDEEIDYITSQLYNNVDIRLNKPIDTDKRFVQEEGTDAAMTNVQQGNKNPKILQVIEDAHVTLSSVPQKTEVPVTSSSHSSDLAAKFLNFLDIPHTDSKIVSPMDVNVHHEVSSQKTPTLLTVHVSVISDSSTVFSPVFIEEKPKNKDEDPSAGSDRGLKKKKTSKDAEPAKDSDMPQDQEENLGNDDEEPKEKGQAFRFLKGTRSNYAELEYDFKKCNKALLGKIDWEYPEGCDYPFDLTKPLPLVMNRNRQMVPVDYFFNNDLKYLQGGISTMTYTNSLTKTKAAQYNLLGNKDMVPNIWVLVKVAYDKHALWVEVMRKHRYGYLKEIVVRRADNDLYRFKEGDCLVYVSGGSQNNSNVSGSPKLQS
nr:hypothetical protein [Tanacetum cinerariifolium]